MSYNLPLIGNLRKGITPVVATVLLLGITVAIGLTVYTQAQGLISEGADTGELDKAQNTDLEIESVYANNESGTEEMQVTITNKGDRAVNTSEFSMYFGPPNFPNPVKRSDLSSGWEVSDENECFTEGKVIGKGEDLVCKTGVKFPDIAEEVEILIRANEFEFKESAICNVPTREAKSC